MQNDRNCNAKRPLLHTKTTAFTNLLLPTSCALFVIHDATYILSAVYDCSLIRLKKPTTKFIFCFSATLRGVSDANIVTVASPSAIVAMVMSALCFPRC